MTDYQKSKLYVLNNSEDNKEFIGATVSSLSSCMVLIKRNFKRSPDITKKLHLAFMAIGLEKFCIEKLEDFPCSSLKELNLRLKEVVLSRDTVENGYNDFLPGLTRKERYSMRCDSDPTYYARESIRKRASFAAMSLDTSVPYIGAPANIYGAYESAPHKDRLVSCKADKKAGPKVRNV